MAADPIAMIEVGPVPVKHCLDGLPGANVPGVVGGGENLSECDLVSVYDRLEPEAFNIEREVANQADAAPARRKNLPSKIACPKTVDSALMPRRPFVESDSRLSGACSLTW